MPIAQHFKSGVYVACRYALAADKSNGDPIIARVVSSRRSGDVLLVNLLNGNKLTRDAAVLTERVRVIPKRAALRVVEAFLASGKTPADIAFARNAAVEAAADQGPHTAPPQLPLALGVPVSVALADLEREWAGLSLADQRLFVRAVMADFNKLF